jgi:thymidylate synthase (FAD)
VRHQVHLWADKGSVGQAPTAITPVRRRPVATERTPREDDAVWGLLDGKGYVRRLEHLGSDLTVVNAARASFRRESARFGPADGRLLRFLCRRKELHPFRHAVLAFEVCAPLVTARQWWKYSVASAHLTDQLAWSEASRRYVTAEPESYVPPVWRSAPESKKQGSGGPLPADVQEEAARRFRGHVVASLEHYEWALAAGMAAELARAFLPAYHLYVTWRWTASLAAVGHFLRERLEDKAQLEIRSYAEAVRSLSEPLFPVSIPALLGESG